MLRSATLLIFALLLAAGSSAAQARFFGKVVDVTDGRTVVVETAAGRMTTRLQYIEIPENDEALAKTLREHLTKIALGRSVEFRPVRVLDRATVGRVSMEGIDLSLQLLRDGAARHETPSESGQAPDQAFEYASNEKKAKDEKRGIWANAAVRESWQMLAESSSERHPVDDWNLYLRSGALEVNTSQTRTYRQSSTDSGTTDANAGLWPEFGKRSESRNEFIGTYSADARQGLTASPGSRLVLVGARHNIELEIRAIYAYRGNPSAIEDDAFIISILSESDDERFTGRNDLTILADRQPLVIGSARRLLRKSKKGVQELLLYKVNRTTLSHLASARGLTVRLARYGGTIDLAIQPDLKQILELAK